MVFGALLRTAGCDGELGTFDLRLQPIPREFGSGYAGVTTPRSSLLYVQRADSASCLSRFDQ